MGVERGTLVLADLTGYTRYLGGTELEHSHDILADLLGVVAGALSPPLSLAKLEGDCVFCAGSVDGPGLVETLDATYTAFRRRQRAVDVATTCECDACRRIGDLDLKFVAHHGEWVRHEVAGSTELTGPDVVVAHRLLKNTVAGHAYALVSDATADALGLGDGMQPHAERYEDIGEVRGRVLDLAARWEAAEAVEPALVSSEDAQATIVREVPASAAATWEALTDPAIQRLWKPALTGLDVEDPPSGRGIGTRSHCVHGKTVIAQEIVEWRPPERYSYRERNPIGRCLWTVTLSESGGATTVTWRMRLAGGRGQRVAFALMGRRLQREVGAAVDALADYLADSG